MLLGMNVKDVVNLAVHYLKDLVQADNILLEEVESVDLPGGEKVWGVTFSYPAREGANVGGNLFTALGGATPREYKTVELTDTGEFRKLKIRSLANA